MWVLVSVICVRSSTFSLSRLEEYVVFAGASICVDVEVVVLVGGVWVSLVVVCGMVACTSVCVCEFVLG